MPVGSNPTSATLGDVPSSSGQDACFTRRIAQVRVLPGRLPRGPQVLPAASLLGREVVRVRVPGGPCREEVGLLVQRDDAGIARRKSGFDSPAVHSVSVVDRAHGPTGRHRPGVAEIRVQLPVGPLEDFSGRKAAGYGWPGPVASGCALAGVRVRIPRLPLSIASVPMVKWRSRLGPNETFRVRFLVGTWPDPDGEADDHPSLLTRGPGFESRSGDRSIVRPIGQDAGGSLRWPRASV